MENKFFITLKKSYFNALEEGLDTRLYLVSNKIKQLIPVRLLTKSESEQGIYLLKFLMISKEEFFINFTQKVLGEIDKNLELEFEVIYNPDEETGYIKKQKH